MKPADFLLGVLDFFAILLPGSLATWLLIQYVPRNKVSDALSFGIQDATATPDFWVFVTAFLFSSYMLGHFVFMAGAQLDMAYDRWRERSKPTAADKTYQAARDLQLHLTRDITGGEFTTLKWAKTYIQVKAPLARVEIDRLEADSKFFRSLVVISSAFAAHFMLRERSPLVGLVAILLAALSYYRFRQQRWKMTELSYGTAVIVYATLASGESTKMSTPGNASS